MRVLPVVCVLLLAGLHYNTCAERLRDRASLMLGKALMRRARAREELAKTRDEPKTDDENAKDMDMLEDIFVGSGHEGSDNTDASGARKENVEKNEAREEREDEIENPSGEDEKGSGTSDDGGIDGTASGTIRTEDTPVLDQQDSTSGSGQPAEINTLVTASGDSTDTETSEPATRSKVNVNSGEEQFVASSGSGQESDEKPVVQGASESEIEDAKPETPAPVPAPVSAPVPAPVSAPVQAKTAAESAVSAQSQPLVNVPSVESGEDAQGSRNKDETTETASKKSEIASGVEVEEDDSGSAEAIRKGIESLSRMLTPVASGYHFELYSGDAQKKNQDMPKESAGESDVEQTSGKGESEMADEIEPVKEKVCRKECHIPMTYQACAVPRCSLKVGTIKDLCFWLCQHQQEVCQQKCEYIERD